jgi:peptide chain release factor
MSGATLVVSAGTGPAEVRRFVALLAELVAGECAERGAVVESAVVRGPDDAPFSVVLELDGAVDGLAGLVGTHALVERSAARGKRSRKRWYAGVSLHERASAPRAGPAIDPAGLEITAMRAGGPGGQHVNKTASAVRVRHAPTGITVRIGGARSQRQNLQRALAVLGAALDERAAEVAAGRERGIRSSHYDFVRGDPVRVYAPGSDGRLVQQGAR